MINEIQPKIKFQNIVQCPFNRNSCSLITQVNLGSIDHDLGIGVIEGLTVVTESNMYNVQVSGGGVLNGKVDTGMCGPDRVLFSAAQV